MSKQTKKLKVAILGSGNIGTDLLLKVLRSSHLKCTLFIGRRSESPGIRKAQELGIKTSIQGIAEIVTHPGCCDLVFDATTAKSHLQHWPILKRLQKIVIDMTPSMLGKAIIPALNLNDCINQQNVNLISCGGQTAIPLAFALTQVQKDVQYIEVVSSIASRSAGPGARINLDEYIENTENGLRSFTRCRNVKTILILNPARPDVHMQTSISIKTAYPLLDQISQAVAAMEQKIQAYVPGYEIIVPPVVENNRVITTVGVSGVGDYLPRFAGNLDIINCAAVATAEYYAKHFSKTL